MIFNFRCLSAVLAYTLCGSVALAAEPTVEELEALAKKAMRQVLQYSMQDAARVSAARMVRDWADAERERAAEANSVTGKKAAAQAAAQDHAAAGGKFAPPPAPIRFQ